MLRPRDVAAIDAVAEAAARQPLDPAAAPFLAGEGEMARRMRALDWSKMPLGPVEDWPQSLRTAVGICLASRHPIEIWWGPSFARIYNDGYRPILGAEKHPQFLGRPGRECWGEIWEVIGPMLEGVRATGKATWSEDFPLMVERNGFLEEATFTFSYTPVLIEDGSVGGIFCACTETTARVLSERRLRTLRLFGAQSAAVAPLSLQESCEASVKMLSLGEVNVPFALLYLIEPGGAAARLAAAAGLEPGGAASPLQIDLDRAAPGWPLAQLAHTGRPLRVDLAALALGDLPGGRFPEPAREAMVLPLRRSSQGGSLGFLVIGASPRLALDDAYQGFFELAAEWLATSLASARIHQEERAHARRAQLGADVGAALTSSTALQLQLRSCCQAMVEHLDAAFARIWVLNEQESVLELRASAGLYQHLDGPHGRVPMGRFKIGLIAQEREPHLTNDVQHDPRVSDKEWAKREGMVAFAGYPLLVEGRLLGVMALFARRALGEETLEALSSVADSIAVGIDRKRIEEERGRFLIGERTALEEAERQRKRLQSLFLQAPAAIAMVQGPDYVVELANPRYLELIGDREVLGKPLFEALPELAGQAAQQIITDVYRTGQPFVGNEVVVFLERHGVREECFFNLIYQPTLDLAGQVEGILLHAFEVTEHVRSRRAAEALAANLATSEERFRLLAEVQPQQVWSADPAGKIDFVNSRVLDYFGRSFERMIGEGWLDGLHPDDVPNTVERWGRSLTTGEPYENEFRLRRASDGSYRWHLALAQPMRDAAGKIVRWFGSNTDLHDRKRTEVEREQLIHALERALRARDDIVAMVSHDLRNPLNVVSMSSSMLAGLLAGDGSMQKAGALVGRLQRASGQMLTLVNDLLDASRIEAGGLQIKPSPQPAQELLDEALESFLALAAEKGLDLSAERPPALPEVSADRARVLQIFSNLLGNAIKFTPAGGTIRLSASPDGREVRYSVRDSGPGIPEADVPHVFDRYWQTRESAAAHLGAGLGLYIAKGIVDAHRGRIAVESAPGRGCTFWFTLQVA